MKTISYRQKPLPNFLLFSALLMATQGCGDPQKQATGAEESANRVEATALAPGIADLHNHLFSEYAYQGAWYHGSILGPEEGDEEWEGMSSCSGNRLSGEQDHAMTYANLICGAASFATSDVCWHGDSTYGYSSSPGLSYSDWPRYNSLAHQQNWWGHLQDAFDDGITLMVVPGVNFRILCDLMEPSNYQYAYNCEDLGAVDLQLAAAWEFVDIHNDWVDIALTPADARRIIAQGKLALILAIEVTDIFPTGEMDASPMAVDDDGVITDRGGVLTQLHYYHGLGVRSVQSVHEFDSRFAGAAVYASVFEILSAVSDFKQAHPGPLDHIQLPGSKASGYGFDLDENGENTLGLTPDGEILINEMMALGMPIDISHLSYKSQYDIYEMAKARDYHPLFHSHGKFKSVLLRSPEDDREQFTPDNIVDLMRVTGGMFGLRTFIEPTTTYPFSGVANDCDGSSKSFAQAYTYGIQELDIPIGFAVDFNGFAVETGPRFGPEACPKASEEDVHNQQAAQGDPRGNLFDTAGLGHIGLLGSGLLADLNAFGVDTEPLFGSSEAYIRMWERSLDPNRSGPAAPPPLHPSSAIQRGVEYGEGYVVKTLRTLDGAESGAYTIEIVDGRVGPVANLKLDGSILAQQALTEGSVITEETWQVFDFSPTLVIKVGVTEGMNLPVVGLGTNIFDGQTELLLDYP